ncbi:MAG: sugar transferase [Anaerolineae bacterium]
MNEVIKQALRATAERPAEDSAVQRNRAGYFQAKRMMDVIGAATMLILLAPLMLLIAIAIKLDSPGPVFFRQKRMGFRWRDRSLETFDIWKFRSMQWNCDQRPHELYVQKWINGEVLDTDKAAKLTNDSRTTRVGRFLRKLSIDELPQLFNVLRGEMSLVGPRPVPLYEVAQYKPWHRKRLEATPGMTGLWQIKGRAQVTIDEMARLDIEYITRQSLWVDLRIAVLTVPAVLSGRGAE